MVLDIILVAILVFFAAKGLAKGFVYTCLHTLGWIAAIVLAWFAAKPLADILDDGSLGMSIRDSLTEKFAMSTAALDNAVAGMPAIISGGISEGVLLVFLFLALLMVVVNCGGEGLAGSIVDSLDSSFIAGALYDSNLLLIVTGGFFS